jgi:hypothetical protein
VRKKGMARTTGTDIAHIAVERSSGNVFADLGFDEPDLELAKALISVKIATEFLDPTDHCSAARITARPD